MRRVSTVVLAIALSAPAQAQLFAAILPASRASEVGRLTTVFATVINAAQVAATDCAISLAAPLDAQFWFQQTNPQNNLPIGLQNEPVTIAAGSAQTFVLGITANSALPPVELEFAFTCADQAAVNVVSGVNTLFYSASDTPVPDVIAMAATVTNDGIVQAPENGDLGFFSVASINVGRGGVIDVEPRMTGSVPDTLVVCETNPVNGFCLANPAAGVTTPIEANETPTFSVFVGHGDTLEPNPGLNRVFLDLFEGSALVGSTSVAVQSGTPPPPPDCPKIAVLMGYWPPTNEMLRQWSINPAQNPTGWTGSNWRSSGFDVYSFFPEFPPDGNPGNDPIGSPGSVGSAESDLRVDYQDTTVDFWRIVDTYQPQILITTSRGGGIGWEVEAIEGGHGSGGDPSSDWVSDQHGADFYPTQATVEARTWDAISQFRLGNRLNSQLPMTEIVAAASALQLTSVQIDQNTSGNYLSGFLGLHGLYYNMIAPHNVTAGHIHVGGSVPVTNAVQLIETTLEVVLEEFPAASLGCPEP